MFLCLTIKKEIYRPYSDDDKKRAQRLRNLKLIIILKRKPLKRNYIFNAFLLIIPMNFFYSGLNFQDLMARQGVIESLPKAPFILGFECSGVIEQVAEGVEKFKVRNICCIYHNTENYFYML